MINRLLLASLFAAVSLSGQTTLFSDDFSSYTAGQPISTPWGSVFPNPSESDAKIEVELDGGNLFSQGTSNQILHVLDESATFRTRADIRDLSYQVATLNLTFYEVSGVTGTPWRISFGLNSSSSGNTAFMVTLNDGNPGSYSLDAVHTAQIVVNTSNSSVAYEGTNVGSLNYDLWIDGILVTDEGGLISGSAITAGTDLTAFRFTTDSGGLSQEIFVNNVTLYEGAVIPEPSTLAYLFGFTGVTALLLYNRHRKVR